MADYTVSSSNISRLIPTFQGQIEIAHYHVVTLSYMLDGVNTTHVVWFGFII